MKTPSCLIWNADHIFLVLGPHKIANALEPYGVHVQKRWLYFTFPRALSNLWGNLNRLGLALQSELTQRHFPSKLNIWLL